ncbi:hypothetical protein [Corynebacterium sp. J010B-136]|nr:hypothetical protein [Corynebacterium sp. J010B-136]
MIFSDSAQMMAFSGVLIVLLVAGLVREYLRMNKLKNARREQLEALS